MDKQQNIEARPGDAERDGPLGSRAEAKFWRADRLRSCVRPCWRGTVTAGPCVDGPLSSRKANGNIVTVRMRSCVRPLHAAL